MIVDPRPIWWRAVPDPPPAAWMAMFEAFTGEETADEWGLAAAIFIARTRRRTGYGPTFSELFAYLIPDAAGLPSRLPDGYSYMERRRLAGEFRLAAAVEWKRRGWISWDPGATRSLRVGRVFREHSRALRAGRVTKDAATQSATSSPELQKPSETTGKRASEASGPRRCQRGAAR